MLVTSSLNVMASSNSQKELIEKLQKKVNAQQMSEKKGELAREIRRCQTANLTDLGAEVLTRGEHSGKTVHQVYTDNLGYVVWVLQHQKNNIHFVPLMEYTKRKESGPQEVPVAKARASPPGRTPGASSDNTPPIVEDDIDWEELTSQPDSSVNENQEMFKAMMGAFNELKMRLDGLQMSAEGHQSNLHQGLTAIAQLQSHQEQLDHRLSSMEQKVPNQ